MADFADRADSLGQEVTGPGKLTRQDVIKRLKEGKNLEDLDLQDLDLAGLKLEGISFRGSDIRGISLYREERNKDGTIIEITTNIRGADFTDAIIADTASGTDFYRVDAEGARFGYTESIDSRRKSHPEDGGGLFRFNGRGGNFKRTSWINIDFGGSIAGFKALFEDADLSGAEMDGCLLAEMDFSETKIENITITGATLLSLEGIMINSQQVESLAQAIRLTNEKEQLEFEKEIRGNGPKKALEDHFKTVILEIKD